MGILVCLRLRAVPNKARCLPMMKAEPHPPASGWFEDRAHVFPVRVYYEDTDFSGRVYHASYLRFMERGRSEFLRDAGVQHAGLLRGEDPLAWVVRRMAIEFLRAAEIDDALQVRTRVVELGGARMRLAQSVSRAIAGKSAGDVVKADVEVCLVTLRGRARRVPDAVRKKLQSFAGSR